MQRSSAPTRALASPRFRESGSRSADFERLLQINVAAMGALSALLLGMGQQSAILPVAALLAAVTSVCFTDFLGWFRLQRQVSNLAAVCAVMIAVIDIFRKDGEHLIAVANLLIYLQIVLLYQRKNERVYWQLLVLSLLQVVVASALNLGFLYGALLTVYLFVGLSGLAMFFVHREASSFLPARRRRAAKRAAVKGGQTSSTKGPDPFLQRPRAVRFAAYAHDDPAANMATWALVRNVVWLGSMTIVLAVAMFFLVPRFDERLWRGPQTGTRMTGFTQEVDLNELGRILENPEMVMRVSFYDYATSRPYRAVGEPYFRGAVLTDYTAMHGRWTQVASVLGAGIKDLESPPTFNELVCQEILLQPGNHRILFGVEPAYRVRQTPGRIQKEFGSDQLLLVTSDQRDQGGQFRYVLGTTAFRGGRQTPLIPGSAYPIAADFYKTLTFQPDRLPTVKARADQLLQDAGLPAGDRIGRARVLEAHFRDSDLYDYSLEMSDERRRDVDPIEDFVANHRTGHCEYFASALTLMLRSQNIPARMVIGFKGGEFNTVGNYYQVRQLHAHAWVEAFLEPHHVRAAGLDTRQRFPDGAWLRLDPTPGSGEDAEAVTDIGLIDKYHEVMDYAQLLWDDYVLGLDWERQRESIYAPLYRRLSSTARGVLSRQAWQAFFQRLRRTLGIEGLRWLQGNWFSWRAGLLAMVTCFVLVGLVRLIRWLLGRCLAVLGTRGKARQAAGRLRVEFYYRLERLLARRGITRAAQQTQREFAMDAGGQLAESPGAVHLTAVPRRVAEAYYRVRFGGQHLDEQETVRLEHSLAELETALANVTKD